MRLSEPFSWCPVLRFAALLCLSCCSGCAQPSAVEVHDEPGASASVAPAAAVKSSDACARVEVEAELANAAMPRRLDVDTVVLRVGAHRCHVTFEYELASVRIEEVDPQAIDRMRQASAQELCADVGARSALEMGGSFTSVYWGAGRRRLGRFTVEASDCKPSARSLVAQLPNG